VVLQGHERLAATLGREHQGNAAGLAGHPIEKREGIAVAAGRKIRVTGRQVRLGEAIIEVLHPGVRGDEFEGLVWRILGQGDFCQECFDTRVAGFVASLAGLEQDRISLARLALGEKVLAPREGLLDGCIERLRVVPALPRQVAAPVRLSMRLGQTKTLRLRQG
jgi:hypothetical protein